MSPESLEPTLLRLDTRPLQQADAVTRALVLLNTAGAPFSGVAVFHASYPIRVPPGPQPVTVHTERGAVLPSRIVAESLTEAPGLPEGKRLWTFDLQVLVADVPARTGVAFAATYGAAPESEQPDSVWQAALSAAAPWPLYETDIHPGEIPVPFALADCRIDCPI